MNNIIIQKKKTTKCAVYKYLYMHVVNNCSKIYYKKKTKKKKYNNKKSNKQIIMK